MRSPADKRCGVFTLNGSLRAGSGQGTHGTDHEVTKDLVALDVRAAVLAEVGDLGGLFARARVGEGGLVGIGDAGGVARGSSGDDSRGFGHRERADRPGGGRAEAVHFFLLCCRAESRTAVGGRGDSGGGGVVGRGATTGKLERRFDGWRLFCRRELGDVGTPDDKVKCRTMSGPLLPPRKALSQTY